MEFEKKLQLVTGRKSPKIKEKIRLKLRLLLNNYGKCILGISNQPDDRLRFKLDQEGYKSLFYVYKSTSLESVELYHEVFQSLYANELEDNPDLTEFISEQPGAAYLFLAARRKKRGY